MGIEPTRKGFADLSLTTWVPRHPLKLYRKTQRQSAHLQKHAPIRKFSRAFCRTRERSKRLSHPFAQGSLAGNETRYFLPKLHDRDGLPQPPTTRYEALRIFSKLFYGHAFHVRPTFRPNFPCASRVFSASFPFHARKLSKRIPRCLRPARSGQFLAQKCAGTSSVPISAPRSNPHP